MNPLDPLDVASRPSPLLSLPTTFSFTPASVTYLNPSSATNPAKVLTQAPLSTGKPVALYDPATSGLDESNISPAEKLRRERARNMSTGVTSYVKHTTLDGSSPSASYLVPSPAGILEVEKAGGGKGDLLTPVSLIDTTSVCGVVYGVVGGEVVRIGEGGEVEELTFPEEEREVTHGLADFLSQEEVRGGWADKREGVGVEHPLRCMGGPSLFSHPVRYRPLSLDNL